MISKYALLKIFLIGLFQSPLDDAEHEERWISVLERRNLAFGSGEGRALADGGSDGYPPARVDVGPEGAIGSPPSRGGRNLERSLL